MQLLLASNNRKKLVELQALFAELQIELLPQAELGIPEAREPHPTFLENALTKARHAARLGHGPAIADDSGLCVEALAGAPGVISAHWAALPASPVEREMQRALQDVANNNKLVEAMAGVTDRRARFVSVLVAVRHAEDPEPLVAFGRWQGEVLHEPRGIGGFGYDPLLYIPELGRSVAELDAATKNRHSHRALAARQMVTLMREAWHA